jgi:hypothetical protein
MDKNFKMATYSIDKRVLIDFNKACKELSINKSDYIQKQMQFLIDTVNKKKG